MEAKTLVINTLVHISAKFANLIILFLLTPFVLNNLSKEEYGLLVLVMSFSAIGGSLSLIDIGMQGAIEKFVAEYHARKEIQLLKKIIASSLFVYMNIGIISSLGLYVILINLRTIAFNIPSLLVPTAKTLFALLSIQVFIEFLTLPFFAFLEGMQRFDFSRCSNLTGRISAAVLTIILLTQTKNVIMISIANLFGGIITLILLMFLVLKTFPSNIKIDMTCISKKQIKELISFGTQLYGFRITGVVYNNADRYIIPTLLNLPLLREYIVAIKFQQFVDIFQGMISSIVMPTASYLNAKGELHKLQKLFLSGTKYTIAITFPVATYVILTNKLIILYWLGNEFIHLSSLSQSALIASILGATTAVGFTMMIGIGNVAGILKINIFSAVLKLLLSLLLAYLIGLKGAIWATIISTFIVSFLYIKLYLKTLNSSWTLFFKESIANPLILSLFLAVFLHLLKNIYTIKSIFELFVIGVISLLIYYICFFSLLEKNEKNVFKNLVCAWISMPFNQKKGRKDEGFDNQSLF